MVVALLIFCMWPHLQILCAATPCSCQPRAALQNLCVAIITRRVRQKRIRLARAALLRLHRDSTSRHSCGPDWFQYLPPELILLPQAPRPHVPSPPLRLLLAAHAHVRVTRAAAHVRVTRAAAARGVRVTALGPRLHASESLKPPLHASESLALWLHGPGASESESDWHSGRCTPCPSQTGRSARPSHSRLGPGRCSRPRSHCAALRRLRRRHPSRAKRTRTRGHRHVRMGGSSLSSESLLFRPPRVSPMSAEPPRV
jgi:hypothetical protein